MGFDQFENDEAITEINVTPLVDITLVLLLIFMVTTAYIVHPSIKVDLPRASTGEKTKPSTVSIVMTREGQLYLNGNRTEIDALVAHVQKEASQDPSLQVVISADTTLLYGRVVWLIDLVKQLGVRRYALNIQYREEPANP
jgi:biopolymer transport protein ExbD